MTGKEVVNRPMSVDGFAVLVLPVLLGHGTPLVTGGIDRVSPAPVSSTAAGAATALRFQTVDRCAG